METRDLLEMEEMLDAVPVCQLDHTAFAGLPNCGVTAVAVYQDCDGAELMCEPMIGIIEELLRRSRNQCAESHEGCVTIRRL